MGVLNACRFESLFILEEGVWGVCCWVCMHQDTAQIDSIFNRQILMNYKLHSRSSKTFMKKEMMLYALICHSIILNWNEALSKGMYNFNLLSRD
jgi:hypothetical protein